MVYIPWMGYNPKWQDQKLITKVYKPKPSKPAKDGNQPHPKTQVKLKTKFGSSGILNNMAASQAEQLNAKQEHLKDQEYLHVTHHDHSHDAEDGKRKGHNHHFFHFIHKHDKHKNGEHKNAKTVKENGDQPKTEQTSQEQHEASQDEPHSQGKKTGSKEETQETKEETPNEGKKPEEHKDHEKEKSFHLHFHGLGFRPMAHCLDFRTRTVSFDLHNIGDTNKMSLLSKLLHRSKSESSMKVPALKKEKEGRSSPSNNSPKQSPGAVPRRRFCRVVRDDQCIGEEYVNPHVTRRFSKNHWEKHFLIKSASLDEGEDNCRPLPYTVTGHTILKKHHSVDSDTLSDANKHAKFNEEVEVLEYDIKGKILAIHSDASILHAKLHDGEFVHDEVVLSRDVCDAISVGEVEVELPISACVTLEVIVEATTPTDLSPDSDVGDSDVTDTTVLTENQTTADPLTDSDAEDLVSDSVFDDPTDSEHAPKASRQISSEEESSVKKTKLEDVTAKSIDIVCEKLKEVES